jgi:hypothetical protein
MDENFESNTLVISPWTGIGRNELRIKIFGFMMVISSMYFINKNNLFINP